MPEKARWSEEDKAELVSGLTETRRQILTEMRALPANARLETFLGFWSARELSAHLIGWDFTNAQAAGEILDGRVPSLYSHHDKNWASYNEALVTRYGHSEFEQLLETADASQGMLLGVLETIPAEEFNRDRGIRFRGWKVTIARLLQAELRDEAEHLAQLAAFRSRITGG